MIYPNYSLPNFNKETIKIKKLSRLSLLITSKAKAYNNIPINKIKIATTKIVNITYCFNY